MCKCICKFVLRDPRGEEWGWCPIRPNTDNGKEVSYQTALRRAPLLAEIEHQSSRTLTHYTDVDPEDGGNIYVRNAGNISHIYKVQGSKSRININKDPP
jgi:hypothetical protein